MARIAVGGFQHETNTFASVKADLGQFVQGDAWPPLTRGTRLPEVITGLNLPTAGFIAKARALGHEIVPLLWCAATPSAHVTEEAFETICGMLIEDLQGNGPLDGVYLDLHGAMVTEHQEDGEGEILHRIRQLIGPDIPLVASLDLHANVSPAMVEHASALVAYRTYPHIDMAQTGSRAARLLNRMLCGQRLYKAFNQIPFLIPIVWQSTLCEPMASLMEVVKRLETGSIASLSFTPGFPLADIADCGPAVFAYGKDQTAVDQAVEQLTRAVILREANFTGNLVEINAAIRQAMATSASAVKPVILADTQDNPGGGSNGDTVTILAALLRHRVEDAVLGALFNPEIAAQAHASGEGAEICVVLGERSGLFEEQPLKGTFFIERLGDGNFLGTGPFYRGCKIQLGPMALLRKGGVRVVVCSRKIQAADQSIFRHLGINPAAHKILVLKSSVHFRADFASLASDILVVEAPGFNIADPTKLPFRRLRSEIRLKPLGPSFTNR
jgi:microcystin degradation protein MlrC